MKENDHVKTAIRWRTPVDGGNDTIIIEKVNDKILSVGSQRKTFTFDHVIDRSDQKEVYDILVNPLVEKSLDGYNCTFLASGQTGSGKTYTMGFESNANVNSENSGMALRVIKSIFSSHKASNIFISFVEIYNDQAFDLLGQNPQESFYKKDCAQLCKPTKKSVQDEQEVNAILTQGTKSRHVRGTKMNSASSRSHAVFTIYIWTGSGEQPKRESLINLVDLAGSEGVRKTGATGEALAEAKSINESLSAVKRVFAAMSTGEKYIPFRDSLITRILKDSLRLDGYLTLLGCVSPFESDCGETVSTLHFVAAAKQIKRTPQLNAIIDAFQQSNTPVKTSHHTPTSSFRSMKQPSPLTAKQNKPSILSRVSRERNQSHLLNSMPERRFTRNIRNIRSSSVSVQRTQPKGYTLQSAMTSRKSLDTALRSEENYHRFDASQELRANQKLIVPPDNEDILNILESLENAFKEQAKDGKEVNRAAITDVIGQLKTKLSAQNPSIDVSFCPESTAATSIQSTMLSTVNEVTEVISGKDLDTNESNANVVSSSCLESEPINVVDQIASNGSANEPNYHLDPTVNVSINYDHTENKILFNVEEKGKTSESTNIYPETQAILQPNNDLWECEQRRNSFFERVSNGNLSADSQHESTRYQEESIEAVVSSTTIADSPIISKKTSYGSVRTPIGKLIIRKVAPACDFENTRYTVELIDRTRQPAELFAPEDYSDFCETPTGTSNKLPMSTAIKDFPNRCAKRPASSPRTNLHRIGSTQEDCHQGRVSKTSKIQSVTVRRTRTNRTTSADTHKTPTKQINERQRLLKILNTGSEKDLQKLPRIGIKTAAQIVKFRNQKGPLNSIEELLKMNWTKNMYQRFVAANIFE